MPLTEKGKGPENPYRVVDRSYANFGESPECELRRIPRPRTSPKRSSEKLATRKQRLSNTKDSPFECTPAPIEEYGAKVTEKGTP